MMLVSLSIRVWAFPALTGQVVDDAHILSPQTERQLTTLLQSETKHQVVVVTLPSLEEKSIEDLTGNISGMIISVRTLEKSKLDALYLAEDKVTKMQIIQDSINNLNDSTVVMSNVEIMIENNNQNIYMGLSGDKPLEVKIPKGRYMVTLTYPNYKVLNDKFELKDSVPVTLETSGILTNMVFIMLPEN